MERKNSPLLILEFALSAICQSHSARCALNDLKVTTQELEIITLSSIGGSEVKQSAVSALN